MTSTIKNDPLVPKGNATEKGHVVCEYSLTLLNRYE